MTGRRITKRDAYIGAAEWVGSYESADPYAEGNYGTITLSDAFTALTERRERRVTAHEVARSYPDFPAELVHAYMYLHRDAGVPQTPLDQIYHPVTPATLAEHLAGYDADNLLHRTAEITRTDNGFYTAHEYTLLTDVHRSWRTREQWIATRIRICPDCYPADPAAEGAGVSA